MTSSPAPLSIALVENIHPRAQQAFAEAGLSSVVTHKGAVDGAALSALLHTTQVLGLRSKTHLQRDHLAGPGALEAIGCYCIGTDQVDLQAAALCGVPVFNAPYSSTRSVAELVIGYTIALLRRIPEKSAAAHQGVWLKSVDGACEVRNKTLGIIGYGHIGTQLSVLAENLGMRVMFYDVASKLALGNAQRATSLDDVLAQADVVTLHVPATQQTENMIDARALAAMKPGAVLINAARGKVVDLDALRDALQSNHLSGAAIDVFPIEPASVNDPFNTPLQNIPNVILTPHIGGSTEEAQEAIAAYVTDKVVRYLQDGSTAGAVNFPQLTVPETSHTRFRHIHRNQPGLLAQINDVFSHARLNIAAQYLQTSEQIGYVVIDTDSAHVDDTAIVQALQAIPGTIRVGRMHGQAQSRQRS